MNAGMVAGYVLILVIITPFVIVGVSWFLVLVAPIGAAATLLICYLWVAKGAQSPHKHRAGEERPATRRRVGTKKPVSGRGHATFARTWR
jgi:hypothetical protein